jgi:glycosyltransferase involved in cell wall biosynthesis
MPKISGYMLCYNEKELIEISIKNMLQFTDELIIVDGESIDGTLDILHRLCKEYPIIKVINGRQDVFRDRNLQNSHEYHDGFNEPYRRNLGMENCTGDYILMKDVDELYHEDFSPHKLVSENPEILSFSINQYEVCSDIHHFPDTRGAYHHDVPRLTKNNKNYRFVNNNKGGKIHGFERRNEAGIDCILQDTSIGKKVSTINDMADAFDMWHYKQVLNKFMNNHFNKEGRTKRLLPIAPKEHKDIIAISKRK